MAITSKDEPAYLVAVQQAVLKLVVSVLVSGGFQISDDTRLALASLVAGVVAAVWSVAQGYLTRSKVFSPATHAEQVADATAVSSVNPDLYVGAPAVTVGE